MEDALDSLSRNLPEAFEETIARIQRLPESQRRLGIHTLMWICHAKCAMTVSELSDALSVKLGQAAMSPKHRPSPKMMVECCQGLVTIDSETMNIRLAHYAIQEYLIGQSDNLFIRPNANIAEICLTYLLFDSFRQGPCSDEDAIVSRTESNPFLSYASRYWGMHAKRSETDQTVQRLIFAFLGSRSAAACANQVMQINNLYREEYWNSEECYSTTALHLASHCGLENTLHKLLDEGIFPVDAATRMGTTPLNKAASGGHVSIVRFLLQRGANPYSENWYGNALHCAAEAGYSGTIRELIRHGMSANACQYYDRIPINCTLDNDHAAAFETLITLGADINACDEDGRSVFHRAAMLDCVNIIDLVLQRRWADLESKSGEGLMAMHYAALASNTAILLKLLDAGADINAEDSEGQTPLYFATHFGNKATVILLLRRGARC
jgi:ankyrin repeat protein